MEQQIEQALATFFDGLYNNEPEYSIGEIVEGLSIGDDDIIDGVRTFEQAGILTNDKGVVLDLSNGKQVFLTIQVQ